MTYECHKTFPDGTSVDLYEPIDLRPAWGWDKKTGKRILTFEGVVQVTFRGPVRENGTFFIRRFNFHRHWRIVRRPMTFLAKLLGEVVAYEYEPDMEIDHEHIRMAVEQMKREYEIFQQENGRGMRGKPRAWYSVGPKGIKGTYRP